MGLFSSSGDYYKSNNRDFWNYVTGKIGQDPAYGINPGDLTEEQITSSRNWQNQVPGLYDQYMKSLSPDKASQVQGSFSQHNADLSRINDIGSKLALGTIGAIAGGAGAQALGFGGTVAPTATEIANASLADVAGGLIPNFGSPAAYGAAIGDVTPAMMAAATGLPIETFLGSATTFPWTEAALNLPPDIIQPDIPPYTPNIPPEISDLPLPTDLPPIDYTTPPPAPDIPIPDITDPPLPTDLPPIDYTEPPPAPDIPIPDVGDGLPDIPIPDITDGGNGPGSNSGFNLLDWLNKFFSPNGGFGSLFDLLSKGLGTWDALQQNKQFTTTADSLLGLFGQDSPYAKALRTQLERRDAASGRRSQYGPREVELQGKLAEQARMGVTDLLKAQALSGNAQTRMYTNILGGLGDLFNLGNTSSSNSSNPSSDNNSFLNTLFNLFGHSTPPTP